MVIEILPHLFLHRLKSCCYQPSQGTTQLCLAATTTTKKNKLFKKSHFGLSGLRLYNWIDLVTNLYWETS